MSVNSGAAVALSPMDEARFGIVSARCACATRGNLAEVLAFCQVHRARMLVVRCPATDLDAAQAIEERGGRLMDVLVYFTRDLERTPIPDEPPRARIRAASADDAPAVRAVAEESFRGYMGHYHADPRLSRGACDATYSDWAYRSCVSREAADHVLVAELGAAIVGFLTLRRNDDDEAEVVLNGVTPSHQRGGIYRSLLLAGMQWARASGASRIVISTQLTNVPVQKAWVRLGFEPNRSYCTFHVWFDA